MEKMEKEKDFELETLLKDLSNYKVQLEANESAHKQALLDLNHYRQKADELSTKLKNSDSQNDIYLNECRECKMIILELESKISDTKLEAFTREELMGTELDMEKKRTEELMKHVEELHETIWLLKMEKDEQLDLAIVAEDASKSEDDVTISKEEYEVLVMKAKELEQIKGGVVDISSSNNNQEMEDLKKELDAARARMGQLRSRAEQAVSRAEAAELAKEGLEEQIRRWRGRKEKRKTALAALREESYSEESSSYVYEQAPKHYVPLAKVLNMEF